MKEGNQKCQAIIFKTSMFLKKMKVSHLGLIICSQRLNQNFEFQKLRIEDGLKFEPDNIDLRKQH